MLATDEVIACFAMYFEGSFAKYRQISHTAYQKQSQSTKHSILTVQKTKKIQATYISNACFTMCLEFVSEDRIKNLMNFCLKNKANFCASQGVAC